MEIKSMWASKINWFVVLSTIADILALTEFKDVLPSGTIVYLVLAQAVVTIIIRNFFTSQPTTQFSANRLMRR